MDLKLGSLRYENNVSLRAFDSVAGENIWAQLRGRHKKMEKIT
jgi:hypothetical protein